MWFGGIDPGAYGALAFVDEKLDSVHYIDWSDNLVEIVAQLKPFAGVKMVVIEQVHAFPKAGVSGMFTFGSNYGAWRMLAASQLWPHQLITPSRWQKAILDSVKNTAKPSIGVVNRLFPTVKLRNVVNGRLDKKDREHGRADAICMALFARKIFLSGEVFQGSAPRKKKRKRAIKPNHFEIGSEDETGIEDLD